MTDQRDPPTLNPEHVIVPSEPAAGALEEVCNHFVNLHPFKAHHAMKNINGVAPHHTPKTHNHASRVSMSSPGEVAEDAPRLAEVLLVVVDSHRPFARVLDVEPPTPQVLRWNPAILRLKDAAEREL